MIRFHVFERWTVCVLCILMGGLSSVPAQNVGSGHENGEMHTVRKIETLSENGGFLIPGAEECPFCAVFPDMEKIFAKDALPDIPPNIQPRQLVDAFCKTCGVIDEMLTEMEVFSAEIRARETRLSELTAGSPEAEAVRAEVAQIRQKMAQYAQQVHLLYHQTLEWIGVVWSLEPERPEVLRYILFLFSSAVDSDQYESAYVLSRELMAQKVCEREPFLYEMAGISAFMVGKFDVARLCFEEAQKRDAQTASSKVCQELIPYYVQAWKTEQTIRQQELANGELPRVIIETTKGTVEIELFENSAPNTVAAFLQLVKDGAYDGKRFSAVVSGLFARTEPVAVNTPFERDPAGPDARKHFRGSVVWAQTETEEQGNGQFFVMFTPAPQLDGKYTVFGRVTKGMDVVSSFRRTGPEVSETGKETAPPDRILSARVLNRPGY